MDIKKITQPHIIDKIIEKKYALFRFSNQPYNLNIVGVRNELMKPNQFDDRLFVFWQDGRFSLDWKGFDFPITTDAGNFYHLNPMNHKGTAQLAEGQYRGSWKIGFHNGKYEALVQDKPVKVYRDNDKDLKHNRRTTDIGLFGMNIHAAMFEGESQSVDKWSAGCQVFQNWADFQLFMALAKQSARLYGNSFTYTLLNSSDFLK